MRLSRLLHRFSHSRSHLLIGSVDRPARRLGGRRHRRRARTLITIADQLHISLLRYAVFLKGNHILTGVIQLRGIVDPDPRSAADDRAGRHTARPDCSRCATAQTAGLALFVNEDFSLFQPLEHRADRFVGQLRSSQTLRFRTCGRYGRRRRWFGVHPVNKKPAASTRISFFLIADTPSSL